MARPRTYQTEAVVVRQTPLGEADRIVTLCAPDRGKIRAVAKGARRVKSRFGGHLELLTRVRVSVAVGRNLDTVTEAHGLRSHRGLRGDLGRLSRAMYAAELIDGFSIENNSNVPAYRLLLEALDWMERARDPDLLLRWFEMRLLDCCGYMPELTNCVECREPLLPDDHLFACGVGGVVCPDCRAGGGEGALVPAPLNAMKALRFLQRQGGYDGLDAMNVSRRAVGEAERVTRAYIRHIIERDVKSAQFVALAGGAGARSTPGIKARAMTDGAGGDCGQGQSQ